MKRPTAFSFHRITKGECFAVTGMFYLAVTVGHAAPPPASCEKLAALKLDHTVIQAAGIVRAGPMTIAGFGPPITVNLPAFCRVSGAIHPVPDSDIRFEVWLPLEQWKGRFEGVGNGGLAGSIDRQAMANGLLGGYATAGTDTGHVASSMVEGGWAIGHAEKIKDFGYRSVHEMTLKSKAITASFYGSNPHHAYWNGCSEGGGQAFSEAQRYPADYDGIVAGAPANYFVHLQSGGNWISQAIHKDPDSFIPASKLPAISHAVLAQCDAADGVTDGVLEDPRSCHVDLGVLLCKSGDSPECLTAPQMVGLNKVYAGSINPRTGAVVYPGTMRGSEAGWGFWIVGTDVPPRNAQHQISVSFFSNMVFDNPNWDWKTFDFDKDVAFADQKIGATLNQIDPDLSAFKKRGGKLLQYHGWNDPAISPLNSINYFGQVRSKMGDTQDFYRLSWCPVWSTAPAVQARITLIAWRPSPAG